MGMRFCYLTLGFAVILSTKVNGFVPGNKSALNKNRPRFSRLSLALHGVNNDANGFHQIATYPLYPGIHSMAIHQFTINKSQWDEMSDAHKLVLETWYYAAYDDLRRQLDLQDKALVSRDTAGGEIEVINWSLEERNKFRDIASGAWEETAAKSPEARAALDAHYEYMRTIGLLQ